MSLFRATAIRATTWSRRKPPWAFTPRWILQGFVGAWRAARTPAEQSEVAWGAGFRYLIARQYGLRTGIDVAFSEHEQAVYCNVGSGL